MYKRAYIEITNVCNLNCSFCHKPSRTKMYMSTSDFFDIAVQVKAFTDYVYLHVFGEPLLHPQFEEILNICNKLGLNVNLTTNGSLIAAHAKTILDCKIRKISFSLHSFEGNNFSQKDMPLGRYLGDIMNFCEMAENEDIIIELRLWNGGGKNFLNTDITSYVADRLQISEKLFDNTDRKLKGRIYVGYNKVFNWASDNLKNGVVDNSKNFCLGLREQFGILCDGSVVPCCIDSEGECILGNVHIVPLSEILTSPFANEIRLNFTVGKSTAKLCHACDFRKSNLK